MDSPLKSLIASGTKLWLDSIDPELVLKNRKIGATGATSNPIIITNLIKSDRFNDLFEQIQGADAQEIAWQLTDRLVSQAEEVFEDIFKRSNGNDGYVSFELDPLLEDPACNLTYQERVDSYIQLGKAWSQNHPNRMIKIPATPAGIGALEELSSAGVCLNVTLIFTERQYTQARNAIWKGAQKRPSLDNFKSVYSIFVSRVDVYTDNYVPSLSDNAQGFVGIVNAKRIWQANKSFWNDKQLRLDQEIVFASTGTKKAEDPAWKYVEAFAGSDIQTNPPETNEAVEQSNLIFTRRIDELPDQQIIDEIDQKIDWQKLEDQLMEEGIAKFANPQKDLIALIKEKL